MKVLIACSSYYPHIKGGGEISTKLLAEGFVKAGIETQVICYTNTYKIENVNNVVVNRIKSNNLYWSFERKSQSKLKKICWHLLDSNNIKSAHYIINIAKKLGITHIITSTIEDVSSSVWKVAKQNNIKVIHILRSYTLLCTYGSMYKNNSNCQQQCKLCGTMNFLKKNNSQYVDIVVGISQHVLTTHIKNGYFKNSVKAVIHNIAQIQNIKQNKKKVTPLFLDLSGI